MDIVIVSWEGFAQKASRIAESLRALDGRVHIIHSQQPGGPVLESHGAQVIEVDNAFFFGRKFARALEIVADNPMLLIQADAECNDWPALVDKFLTSCATHPVGVWAPDVHHTSWSTAKVMVRNLVSDSLIQVSQTDAIVVGFSREVVARLRKLDFSENNLGWGIDWAAIVSAISFGQLVVRDTAIKVRHVPGSGYKQSGAARQQEVFLQQLNDAEQAILVLLRRSHALQRTPVKIALSLSRLIDQILEWALRLVRRRARSQRKADA